ncbi:MAG: 2-oxoacid:acceptor oxidoreductase subunit alpha [Planctomycetota bacterium]|nr:2-oxoacid:acceptor oxidoreductase subunit alpha [Planctomycetota bacterium]
MSDHEFTVGIGGAAGDGIASTENILARTCARLGMQICAYNSYQSVIRGGHIWLRMRAAEKKIQNHGDHLTMSIALNQDALNKHNAEVNEGGYILYNSDRFNIDGLEMKKDVDAIGIPVKEISAPFGGKPLMQNTVALGAAVHLLGLELDVAIKVVADIFSHKGEKVISTNQELLRAGYEFVQGKASPLGVKWEFSRKSRPVITGNEAIAMGAAAAGCKFYAAYPMTPASSVLHWMAGHADKLGIAVKQAEDELAVANMTIGAGYAGVRAMCATSGGGFALMTEAIGMAGMIEAPCVFVEVQRGGPSTGLPTKTEQGDLNQVYGASQGDYPRIILAPTSVMDMFDSAPEAFNLADRYQCPVIVLSDLYLSEHDETVDIEDFNFEPEIDRGLLVNGAPTNGNGYERYAQTDTGVSPRALPGNPGTLHVAGTDEHNERGDLISDVNTDPATRIRMMDKRERKIRRALKDLPAPTLHGPADAPVTLIGWGSSLGLIREAMELLEKEGIKTNHLQIKYIHPFHTEEVSQILSNCKKTVMIETNFSGQFERHLRAETGISVDAHIRKYDGEPIEPLFIVEHIKEILS